MRWEIIYPTIKLIYGPKNSKMTLRMDKCRNDYSYVKPPKAYDHSYIDDYAKSIQELNETYVKKDDWKPHT